MKIKLLFVLVLSLLSSTVNQSIAQINRYSTPAKTTIRNTQVLPNTDVMIRALQMREERDRREHALEMEAVRNCINQNNKYYNNFSNFPTVVPNGWHNVTATNNSDFCGERLVQVYNNKVVKYFIDGYYERPIAFSSAINNGKAMIKLENEDGSKSEFIEAFFIENIIDPSTRASEPQTGQVTFWSDIKRGSNIHIALDGEYLGELSSYFVSEPNCSQSGTISIKYKTGTYNYVAEDGNRRWTGTVTITKDRCRMIKLTK